MHTLCSSRFVNGNPLQRLRIVRLAGLCAWLCATAANAHAMADVEGNFTNAPPPAGSLPAHMDSAHRHLSAYVEGFADGLDALLTRTFGGGPSATNDAIVVEGLPALARDPTGGSRVILAPSVAYSEEEGTKFRNRFFARLDLPRFEDRVQIVALNIQADEDVLTDFADPISRDRRLEGENDKVAGLLFVLIEDLRFDLSAAAGLRFTDIEPVPKLRLRGRVKYTSGATRYELANIGFWQGDDGFGQKTEASVRHGFTPRFSVRNTGALLIREEFPGVELGNTLALHYLLPHRRSIGLKLGAHWLTEPDAVIDFYSVRVPFRQGIWRQWLYLQIEPGADFRNEDDFDISPLISVGLEITFGNPSKKR